MFLNRRWGRLPEPRTQGRRSDPDDESGQWQTGRADQAQQSEVRRQPVAQSHHTPQSAGGTVASKIFTIVNLKLYVCYTIQYLNYMAYSLTQRKD